MKPRRPSRGGGSPLARIAQRQTAPRSRSTELQPGQRFEGYVRDLAADGNGVVQHPQGQIFFVPGVWVDEHVLVRVTSVKGRFGFAELETVLTPSSSRVEPPCPYQGFGSGACGGCPWQFVDYPAQLAAKQQRVRQALTRLVDADAIQPILPAPAVFGYRGRAQFKTDGERLGYMAASSRNLVDVQQCLILTDRNQQTLTGLRQALPRDSWRPRRKNTLTTLDIDESVDANSVWVNRRLPFQQANQAQNGVMRAWLSEKLDPLERSLPILELFAGSGNFTEVAVNAGFEQITAVEVVDEAMANLRERFPQVRTQACDLFADQAALYLRDALKQAKILLLDPPRDGLKNPRLKSDQGLFHKTSRLEQVFYISCNLATFARDLEIFVEHGYRVQEVQPLDQFPHTPHIELMAHLQRQ